jgi:hypothetical protein
MTQIALPERAAIALGTAEHERVLIELSTKYADIVEIKNPAGREQAHGAYMTLKNARITVEKAGKDARDEATKFSKAVITEVDRLTAITADEERRLQNLRDTYDAEREAEKEAQRKAEAIRIEAIRRRIEEIRRHPTRWIAAVSKDIGVAADHLSETVIAESEYAEFTEEAKTERDHAVKTLRTMEQAATEREEQEIKLVVERAEIARLRAEQEARDHVAAMERAAADEAARKEREAAQCEIDKQRAELARHQAALDAEKAEQARKEREIQEAETARIRAEQDAAIAEQKRRERVQFELNGPAAAEMVEVLAAHYGVKCELVLYWINLNAWAEVEITA